MKTRKGFVYALLSDYNRGDAGDFPRGSDTQVGSGLRGSGSYVDLRPPVILIRIVFQYRVTCFSHCIAHCAAPLASWVITNFTEDIKQRHSSVYKMNRPRVQVFNCRAAWLRRGEGYIRIGGTTREPSAVNHWRTHHRKEDTRLEQSMI